MRDRVKGKVAIVTGAGSAIPGMMSNGKVAFIVYAREGARVVLVGRSEAVEETNLFPACSAKSRVCYAQ